MVFNFKAGAPLGESAATLLAFAVLPIAKVFVMCALGYLVASPYIGVLSKPGRKQLTKLVFSVFLPCLIFTQLGNAVTLEKIAQWWFIPVNVILASTLGCAIGYVVALIVKPPPQFFNFTFIMIGIGNIGNIPLVIIGAICGDASNPFGDEETCNANGVAYLSFGQWVGAVIVYTFVYQMLAPPEPSAYDIEKPDKEFLQDPAAPGPDSPPAVLEAGGLGDEGGLIPLLGYRQENKLKAWAVAASNAVRIQDILQPPVVASFLAILIGVIPFLKGLFYEDGGALFFITDSLSLMGGAMVPCIMLALGGNLVEGAGSSELGLRTTVAITATRLLVTPLAGLAIVTTADKLGLLPPNDPMFRFVLLLQHTMPTSILAGGVTNLRGHGQKEATAILFYEHVLAVLSMAGWLILYVNVLF